MVTVEIPDDLVAQLQRSRLGERTPTEQVRIMLAMQLAVEGVVSVGRAAELAGEPRITFELRMVDLGLPVVQYDIADYEVDQRSIAKAMQRAGHS